MTVVTFSSFRIYLIFLKYSYQSRHMNTAKLALDVLKILCESALNDTIY